MTCVTLQWGDSATRADRLWTVSAIWIAPIDSGGQVIVEGCTPRRWPPQACSSINPDTLPE